MMKKFRREETMSKIKVWEKPIIFVLGVEETQNPGKGPCLNPKHANTGHYIKGTLVPMVPGHGYLNAIS